MIPDFCLRTFAKNPLFLFTPWAFPKIDQRSEVAPHSRVFIGSPLIFENSSISRFTS
jgi:hypothetical protein